jgi:hypothetical protein
VKIRAAAKVKFARFGRDKYKKLKRDVLCENLTPLGKKGAEKQKSDNKK